MARALGVVIGVVIILGIAVFFGSKNELSNHDSEETTTTTNSAMISSSTASSSLIEVAVEEPVYFEGARGFYAAPRADGDYQGVLIIHEWWGLNDNIRDTARMLAREGYRVLAVDLFGKVAVTSSEAQAQVAALNQVKALENLKAGLAFLRGKGAERLVSLGWCFGGGQSMQLALSGEKLNGTIIYYGNLVTDPMKLKSIEWPVLGIFGDQDRSISTSSVRAFKDALSVNKISNEVAVYPGVGHAFANPTGQNYAPNETKDAWSKTLSFLAQNLKLQDLSAAGGTAETEQGSEVNGAKQFFMESSYEVIDGKPKQQFSLNEMKVKKGDKVRVIVKNTKGMHDFVIDEYKIKTETPLDKETVIEFTADKSGDFVYYCSKPGHRAGGQWGTLRVSE